MTISRWVMLTLILSLTGYIGFNIQSVLAPPSLELFAPAPGLTTSAVTLEVRGKTQPGAEVRINGSLLLPTTLGEFAHKLA